MELQVRPQILQFVDDHSQMVAESMVRVEEPKNRDIFSKILIFQLENQRWHGKCIVFTSEIAIVNTDDVNQRKLHNFL